MRYDRHRRQLGTYQIIGNRAEHVGRGKSRAEQALGRLAHGAVRHQIRIPLGS